MRPEFLEFMLEFPFCSSYIHFEHYLQVFLFVCLFPLFTIAVMYLPLWTQLSNQASTFTITYLLNLAIDPKGVAVQLGHSKTTLTKRGGYVRLVV